MKKIILLSLFIYSLSLTQKYYTPCNESANNITSPNVYKCRLYDPPNGSCCLVYLDDGYEDVVIDELNDADIVRFNVTKKRNLDTYDQFCYGFTKEGLNHINTLKDELSKEFDAPEVYIRCTNQKSLKYNLLNTLIIIILIIMNL